jgi:drug/metabolite transporter (DMT)-like permease
MPQPNHHTSGNLRSIVAMLVAVGFFALMDAVLKLLSARYPVLQIAALRGMTALPLVLLYITWRGAWGTVWRVRWPLHVLRGVLGIAMLSLFTLGVRELPLSATYTLFFIAPLLITVLSVPVLKERVPTAHWWAVAIGFVGVLVALRPSGDDLQAGLVTPGGLAVLGAALCYAVAAVVGRLASRTDSSESMVLWMMVMMALGAGAWAAPDWVAIRSADVALLLALAVTGFGGQLAITEAFRHGQASAVAPFEYSALAWGLGLDWLIWQSLPAAHTWLGAAIIVGSGLYLVRREKRITEAHAHAEHLSPFRPDHAGVGQYRVQRHIVNFGLQLGQVGKVVAQADGEGFGLQAGQGAVVKAAAVAQPVAARPKAHTRHKNQGGFHNFGVFGFGDAKGVFFHGAAGVPGVEGEGFVHLVDHRQGNAAVALGALGVFFKARFLPAKQGGQGVKFAFDGPVGANDGVGPFDQPHPHDALQQLVAPSLVG